MRFNEITELLRISGPQPKKMDEYEAWQRFVDLEYMLLNTITDDALLYYNGAAGKTSGIIISLLVPKNKLKMDYVDDLMEWDSSSQTGWGYGSNWSKGGRRKKVSPPLSGSRSKIISSGEPLLFHRYFEGHSKESYVELNQKIAQMLDIFWVDEKDSYCRFDRNGDYDEIVKLHVQHDWNFCTMKKRDLDFYMYLTGTVMVRLFDFVRLGENLSFRLDGPRDERKKRDDKKKIYCDVRLVLDNKNEYDSSWVRGFQIVGITEPFEQLEKRGLSGYPTNEDFATFVALDFKHRKVCECSCNPCDLDSYFEDTGKPFQTTPAFFKPEVLLKYKQDPDKYNLGLRSISCRGAWGLKRYDINDDGQVNAFLIDLAALPYNEQLYWKSFNESPKGSISRRSYQSDFLGEIPDDDDSIMELESTLYNYPKANYRGKSVTIWELHGEIANRGTSRLNHVVTESSKEWEDQILELAKVLVDGLNKSSIKAIAMDANCYDSRLGSIKLLESCLNAKGVEKEVIDNIIHPLANLYKLRSSIVAHSDDRAPCKNLAKNYDAIVRACAESFKTLSSLIEKGVLNID